MALVTVSPKKIEPGDVIAYYGHTGQAEPNTKPSYGLVHAVIRGPDNNISGFEVFPLTAYALGTHVPNDKYNYMIGRHYESVIREMGLDPNNNHRIQYDNKIVANDPSHLSNEGKGGVTRSGTMKLSGLFDQIRNHIATIHINHIGLLGLEQDLRHLQGTRAGSSMSAIETYRLGEAGRINALERARQDEAAAAEDAVIIERGFLPAPTKERQGRRRRNPLGAGLISDISLDDATKAGLITTKAHDFLLEKHGSGKSPGTLREAFILVTKTPEKFAHTPSPHGQPVLDEPITMTTLKEFLDTEEGHQKLKKLIAPGMYNYCMTEIKTVLRRKNALLKNVDISDYTKGLIEEAMAKETIVSEEPQIDVVSDVKKAWGQFMDDMRHGRTGEESAYAGMTVQYPEIP